MRTPMTLKLATIQLSDSEIATSHAPSSNGFSGRHSGGRRSYPLSQRERGTGGEDYLRTGGEDYPRTGGEDYLRTGGQGVRTIRGAGSRGADRLETKESENYRREEDRAGGRTPSSAASASATPLVHPNPSCVGYSPPPARRRTSTTSYFSVIFLVAA